MKPLFGEVQTRERVKQEKKNGIKYAEVTLGEELLIHSYFFKTQYIAYRDITRLYMRVAGGEFGEFPMDEYSLVILDKENHEHVLHVERGEYIQGVQEYVQKHHPQILLGKPKA